MLFAVGRRVGRLGARWGFARAFGTWSVAQFATSPARGIGHFMVARFALGIGESGALPGSIRAVSEWVPQKERVLANGLFNAGTNIGSIVTPLIIPNVVLSYGWQMAFVVTGLAGLIWLLLYRRPQDVKRISQTELDWIQQDPVTPITRIGWPRLLRLRQTWTYTAACSARAAAC